MCVVGGRLDVDFLHWKVASTSSLERYTIWISLARRLLDKLQLSPLTTLILVGLLCNAHLSILYGCCGD